MYKYYCERLKIDYKKDFLLYLAISLFLLLIGIILLFTKYSFFTIFLIMISFFNFYFHYIDIETKYKKLCLAKEIAFNSFFRYLLNILENNVILFEALKIAVDYCDEVLSDDINSLIDNIEQDTSLTPFIEFSHNFENVVIKQLIILLYQTQEVGSFQEVLESINEVMISLQDNAIDEFVNKESKVIEKHFLIPIILSAVLIIIFSLYVLNSIEDVMLCLNNLV